MKTLVVMPTYGRIPFLGRALASFLSQTYDDKELVIVNDDKNVEICCKYRDVICINLNKKLLIGQKKNLAINVGHHDLILPHDDDDMFLPQRIANCVKLHTEHPDVGFYFNERGYILYGDQFYIDLNTINGASFTRKCWFEAGGYAHPINVGEDRAFREAAKKQLIVKDDSIVDYIYQYGGVNYHLTFTPNPTIDTLAYQQLAAMNLLGKKYWVEPDFEEYNKFLTLDEWYRKTRNKQVVEHVSLAKIKLKSPL